MKPSTRLTAALATLFLVAPLTGQTIKFDKTAEIDYSGALTSRLYERPEHAIDDIRSLAPPWNHIFTIPVADAILVPAPEHWVRSAVLDQNRDFAIVEAAAAIPDGIGAGTASASSVHVILLLERSGRSLHIADHIILRASAYNGSTPSVIKDPGWGPVLHLDTYQGGRRDGKHIHNVFTINTTSSPHRWTPVLQMETRYSQAEGSQYLSFGAAPGTGLAATVTSEPGQNRTPPADSASLTLTFLPDQYAFDTAPLHALLKAQAEAEPVAPTPPPHSWVITPGRNIGPVTFHTTPEQLATIFGPANVIRGKIPVGEGEEADGFYIYPDTEDKLELVLGPNGKIVQANIRGKKSRWVTDTGIALGASPNAVQDANGQPFEISNFEWDYPGLVESWGEGSLNDDLRVQFSYTDENAYQKLLQQTEAAGRWNGTSDSSGMRSLALTVTTIFVVLKP